MKRWWIEFRWKYLEPLAPWRFRKGFGNLRRYWMPVWDDYDCDWAGLMPLMETKFKMLAEHQERNQRHVGWERTARECRMASTLCKRIHSEKYGLYLPNYCPPIGPWQNGPGTVDGKTRFIYSEYMIQQDLALLSSLMENKLRGWWG